MISLNYCIALAVGASFLTGVIVYWRSRARYATLKRMYEAKTLLTIDLVPWSRVNELIEHDRQRIASDLHDELGTLLSVIHLDLELVTREAEVLPPHIEAKLLTVKKNLNVTIETIRNTVWNLSPNFLEKVNLTFAIRELCNKLDALKGTHMHFVQSGTPSPISQKQKLNLFRIVQELLTNAIKHSGAWNISVQLHWDDEKLTVTVEDDGSGYKRKDHEKQTSGLGSINMIKRANVIGAMLSQEELSRGLRTMVELKLGTGENVKEVYNA
jgi:signal transduction histidine kinase